HVGDPPGKTTVEVSLHGKAPAGISPLLELETKRAVRLSRLRHGHRRAEQSCDEHAHRWTQQSCDEQAEHETVACHGHPSAIRGDESTSGYVWAGRHRPAALRQVEEVRPRAKVIRPAGHSPRLRRS